MKARLRFIQPLLTSFVVSESQAEKQAVDSSARGGAAFGPKNRARLLPILIVFGLLLGLYGLFLPQHHSADDLQYAGVIRQVVDKVSLYHPAGGRAYDSQTNLPEPTAITLINPRYPLEWPTSIAATSLWRAMGWTGDVVLPVQSVRLLAGLLGLVFFFLAVKTLTDRPGLAILATIGLALTVSYWTYSTRLDQSINMVALICLALYLYVRGLKAGTLGSWRGSWLLLLVLAVATLYNFTAAISAVALGLGIALAQPGEKWTLRLRRLVIFGLSYGVLVIFTTLLLIAVVISPGSLVDPQFWKSATFAGHSEYNFAISKIFRGIIGLAKSQMSFPGVTDGLQDFWDKAGTLQRVVLLAFYGLILLIMALPVALLWRGRKEFSRYNHISVVLIIWFALFSAFNFYWDPGYVKYWLIPLVCWWTLVALALDKVQLTKPRLFRSALVFSLLFIAVSFVLNLTIQFWPDSDAKTNPWVSTAQSIGRETDQGALFISTGHPIDFYLTYFGNRDLVSTKLISYDNGGDVKAVEKVVTNHVNQHRTANKPVYIFWEKEPSASQRAELLRWAGGKDLKPAKTFQELTLYEVVY